MSSASPASGLPSRAQLRWHSIGWALLAGVSATAVAGVGSWLSQDSTAATMEVALRSGGCGLFYGLLAFHLQRVDPGDSHLQAGLVGAVCAIRSLGAASELPPDWANQLAQTPSTVMMGLIRGWLPLWLPLWMPLIGSALALRALQHLTPRLLTAPRP